MKEGSARLEDGIKKGREQGRKRMRKAGSEEGR